MAGAPAAETPAKGRLADNIVHFARALRKAGVPVGTSQVRDAVRAAAVAGFSRRDDFYHLLRATLITRAEHLDVFHQVFTMFWRDPEYLEKMIRLLSPMIRGETEEKKKGRRTARLRGVGRCAQGICRRAGAHRGRDRRATVLVGNRDAAGDGFRADERH